MSRLSQTSLGLNLFTHKTRGQDQRDSSLFPVIILMILHSAYTWVEHSLLLYSVLEWFMKHSPAEKLGNELDVLLRCLLAL